MPFLPLGSRVALTTLAVLASAVLVGDVRAQDAVARAVDELADVKRREHGVAVLLAAGEQAIPPLRHRLAACLEENEPPEAVVVGILEAFGRMPLPARAAMPEIHGAYMFGSLAASNLAMWTATNVAVANDPKENIATSQTRCDDVASWLKADWRPKGDAVRYAWAEARLALGARPSEAGIRMQLAKGAVASAAAAHAAASLDHISDDLRGDLREALVEAVSCPDAPWLRPLQYRTAEGDLAVALQKHGERSVDVALGLLRHWQARHRISGLGLLAGAKGLSAEQCLRVVMRLWDADRHVRDHTIAALQGMGPSAIVALRALRAFEVDEGSGRRAVLYRRCAERIVATACENLTPAAAELVRHADAVLQGKAWTGPITACDQTGSEVLAAIVIGCRGAPGQELPQLAELAVARGAFKVDGVSPLQTAFVASLHANDFQAWTRASDALIAIGPDVIERASEFRQLLADSLIATGRSRYVGMAFAVEAKARAGKRTSLDELRALAASPEWHLATHAAIELLDREALELRDVKTLQNLTTSSFKGFEIYCSHELRVATGCWETRWSGSAPYQPTHAIGALALASLGKTPWKKANCAVELADELSVRIGKVPDTMRAICAERSFVKHARMIEERAFSQAFWLYRIE